MAARKNPPPKGVVPPQLQGKGFDVHPEHRNKKGAPTHVKEFRDMLHSMGAEKIQVLVKNGKKKQTVDMTRWERIALEWFESQSVKKQELLMGYSWGKPTETIELTGQKVIQVTIKRKS